MLAWQEQKPRCFIHMVLLPCASVQMDMYNLKQRPDFKEKFNLPDEEEGKEGGAPDKPWKQRKDAAQLEAEIAERTAQLAAAAAGVMPPPQQQAPAQQQAPPETSQQQPARSWWSVKLKW